MTDRESLTQVEADQLNEAMVEKERKDDELIERYLHADEVGRVALLNANPRLSKLLDYRRSQA